MAGRAAEVLLVMALATAVTGVVAMTVLRAPSERVFGMPIVGWHHDPFTVMQQFEGAPRPALYWQPVTDVPGELLAKAAGGVAAYNWIVLLTFPLAAGAAFLLAKHLSLSTAGAAFAAMAFAFAPFHVAHAAYHPHIAQVQWIPIYLLALWRCLDRATWTRAALLAASVAGVALSNFYGGLIAAVITPVAIGAYSLGRRSPVVGARNVSWTLAALAVMAIAGAAFVFYRAPGLVADRAAFGFPAIDIERYSASVWSFLTPPVAHPLFGAAARRFWDASGMRVGMLEQQVFLGWSLLALALIPVVAWLSNRRGHVVPLLLSIAAVAFYFATNPPAWLYHALPMFRSYARFGVVIQLMTALAAGMGFDWLWTSGTWRRQAVAVALALLVVAEYAVSPLEMSRPVAAARPNTGAAQ